MTNQFFSRACKFALDHLNGNAGRRRHLKARAVSAMLANKRPGLIRAELASHRKQANQPELQARIQRTREQIQQRLDWHRHP